MKYQQNLLLLEDMQRQKRDEMSVSPQQSQMKSMEKLESAGRVGQELLQQTIEKQGVLQQALKSLEGQNRSLS